MPMSRENLQRLWESAKKYPILFGQEISENFDRFLEVFFTQSKNGDINVRGILWIVDNFIGAFYLTDITDTEATIHYSFFDGRVRGRIDLGKEAIKYVFNHFGFQRLNAEVPDYASGATFNFIQLLGFKKEGVKRKAVKYHRDPDKWFDLTLFGILNTESVWEADKLSK